MYKLNIKGSTREAEYDVNPETGELEQTTWRKTGLSSMASPGRSSAPSTTDTRWRS